MSYRNIIYALIRDPYRKSIPRIFFEAVHCAARDREMPVHYFSRFLYRKGSHDYTDFISNTVQRRIQQNAHAPEIVPFFENKLLFDLHFRGTKVVTPPVLGYLIGSTLRHTGGVHIVKEVKDLRLSLLQMTELGGSGSLFAKPISGIQGGGCLKIDRSDLENDESHIARKVLNGGYLFQPTLRQHTAINSIYSGSLNTIRMDTIWNRSRSEYEVLSATLRFGAGGSFVDNVSSGGCFVPIDMQTGSLRSRGYNLLSHGGKVYDAHPTTGVKFGDTVIPFFEEAKDMVISAADILPTTIVGWDVAITDNGPVIIEANHDYAIRMSEISYGGYRNHPAFVALLREMDREGEI